MTTTPKELIAKRETLISEIKRNWSRINAFNVLEKTADSPFDLKAVYKTIVKDSIDLVQIKVAIQAINMGLKSLKDLPEDNVYTQIFMLSQLKEQKVKFNLVPTKGAKTVFSRADIEKEISIIEKQIISIESDLENYNSTAIFTI